MRTNRWHSCGTFGLAVPRWTAGAVWQQAGSGVVMHAQLRGAMWWVRMPRCTAWSACNVLWGALRRGGCGGQGAAVLWCDAWPHGVVCRRLFEFPQG